MKKLMTGLALIGLAVIMTAANAISYKVYLPIVFKNDPPVYEWHQCTWDLYDQANFQAGQVHAWIKVEYHPDGPVRLVEFYDTIDPATYTWTYFKWYARPARSNPWWSKPYEINLLWVNPVGHFKEWQSTYVESLSAWEAVTHLGGAQGYTLEILAFKQGHYRYPVECLSWVH